MSMSIQYAGFQVQPHGRDYAYYVLDPPAASRHLTGLPPFLNETRRLFTEGVMLTKRKR